MPSKPKESSRLYTLSQAAKTLCLSYERVRRLVNEGRLRATVPIPKIGRLITEEELARFLRVPRRPGRPRRPQGRVTLFEVLLREVASETRVHFTVAQVRRLIHAGLAPHRREFTHGPEGRGAWFNALRARLVRLTHLKQQKITDTRDRALILKLDGEPVPHTLLNRALLEYLFPLVRERNTLIGLGLADAAAKYSERKSPQYPGTAQMSSDERMEAAEGFILTGTGRGITSGHLRAIQKAMQEPELRTEEAKKVQALNSKVIALMESTVTRREDGKYIGRPLAPLEETEEALAKARQVIARGNAQLTNPKVPVRIRMFWVALIVAQCLILLRENRESLQAETNSLKSAIMATMSALLETFSPSSAPSWLQSLLLRLQEVSANSSLSPEESQRILTEVSQTIEAADALPDRKEQARKILGIWEKFVRQLSVPSIQNGVLEPSSPDSLQPDTRGGGPSAP